MAAASLPLPLAAGAGARGAPDPGHGPRPRGLVRFPLYSGHRRPCLGRRMERHPHEHAQLRRYETLTPTLYHSGLSGDVGAVVRHYAQRFALQRVALVGYSMGGNLVLKLAGEWGSTATRAPWPRSAPPSIWLPAPMPSTTRQPPL